MPLSLKEMDIRQLQAFLAVVEHGGFTAAAKATHTVQSNISNHVARLERELETTLIDRATGRPTEEGSAVTLRARRIQNELVSMKSDISSLQGSPKGIVRFGMIGTTARWLTPLLVKDLIARAPDVKLMVTDGTTRSITTGLLNGDLDIGLVGFRVEEPDLQTTPLFQEEKIVIAPLEHPLANLDRPCSLKELAKHPMLVAATTSPFRKEVEDSFKKRGLAIKLQLEVEGLRLLASLALQGFGVAIVPASAVSETQGPWKLIQVDGLTKRTVGLAIRKKGIPTMATKTTINALQKVTEEKAPLVEGISLVNKENLYS